MIMRALIKKEIKNIFTSLIGFISLIIGLLSLSLLLWFFGGNYNLLQSGYADLDSMFHLIPLLLLFLVPALTMGLIVDERRHNTLNLLRFRPIHVYAIVLSKYIAVNLLLSVGLLLTLLGTFSVSLLSTMPLDAGVVFTSYLGLILVGMSFTSIGLFVSSFSRHQVIAYLLTLVLNFLLFYGGDLMATLTQQGDIHTIFTTSGMRANYQVFLRGLIDMHQLYYFLVVIFFFLALSHWVICRQKTKFLKVFGLTSLLIIVSLFFLQKQFIIRYDASKEKRYSLSTYTRQLMAQLKEPLQVRLYLSGDLNPSFYRLKEATLSFLEEVAGYSSQTVSLQELNPNDGDTNFQKIRQKMLAQRGVRGLMVNENTNKGVKTQRMVYPFLELTTANDTIAVSLLQRNTSQKSLEIINASIDQIEFQWSNALRLLVQKESPRIAFIEGHGELTEADTYEATQLLSKYYTIDRGRITNDYHDLLRYKVLIIAGGKYAFTDEEKCVLDSYVMHGGSLLLLQQGLQYNLNEFEATGEATLYKSSSNLDDLLFTYGLRIQLNIVQDMNCTPIQLTSNKAEDLSPNLITLPWYFSPLLQPSEELPMTRLISPLKSEYVSTVSKIGNTKDVNYIPILHTSDAVHLLQPTDKISLRYVEMPAKKTYFKVKRQVVGWLAKGKFSSLYQYQVPPPNVVVDLRSKSEPTSIIVLGSSSLIQNEWKGKGRNTRPIPLGYETVASQQLGNPDFIVNCVNYLAGCEELIDLRQNSSPLRLIDSSKIIHPIYWQLSNVLLPLLLLFLMFVLMRRWRKNVYFR
jgi:ABC-2 type transport system permease protein